MEKKIRVKKLLLDKFIFYGLHVGGLRSFWCPRTKSFLIGFRNDFGIINLVLLYQRLRQSFKFLSKVILSRRKILFVGSPKSMDKLFYALCQKFGHYIIFNVEDSFFTNSGSINSTQFFTQGKPSLIFFFDSFDYIKVRKGVSMLNIPIMAFVSTLNEVDGIDYAIPANINTWKGGLFVYNCLYNLFLLDHKRTR